MSAEAPGKVYLRMQSIIWEEPQGMKKTRILSLILSVLMIASAVVLAGCSEDEDEKKSANTSTREIVALNMYILTEDTTTQDAATKVQMAINEILLPNYKTMVKINYLTEDKYWDTVNAMLEETDPENSEFEESAFVKGTEKLDFAEMIEFLFKPETTDIELSQPQIDIFVVNDYEKYTELVNDEKLKALNSYLDYDSKILKTSVHPTFLSAAQVGTSVYGVPTNIGVDAGEYTYLVFNEDLLKKYNYSIKDLTIYSGTHFSNYLATIKANEPGVWPVSGPLGLAGQEFYDDAFVVIPVGLQYIANDCKPTFMLNLYNANQVAIENYKKLGYYPAYDAGAGAKYAIKIETSDKLLTADEDKRWTAADGTTYVRYLYDIPRVSVDEAFSSVMCVSATSPEPDRAMEIITLFQTNSELANLLQYGIEGVNYQIDGRDGSLVPMDDTYSMDNYVTGNTFIKYPPENNKEYLADCIDSNLGTAPSALLGFNLDLKGVEKSQYETVKNILVAGKKAVENGTPYDEVRKVVNRELNLLGYEYVNTSDLAGIYGRVQLAQRQLVAPIGANFRLSDEIMTYNAHVGLALEEPVVEETTEETAEGEAVEGEENAEGTEAETAEGAEEVAEGEETAEAAE